MSNGKNPIRLRSSTFQPLSNLQLLGTRAYQALLNGIVHGGIEPGTQLRPDVIAEDLAISTTPVREALGRLESDGVVVKVPYQGWFVREFSEGEIRDLYEVRANLEAFSERLACDRSTREELAWLQEHQAYGEEVLKKGDIDEYRFYNRHLHAAILKSARNSDLSSIMSQIALRTEMLMAKTVRLLGRPARAVKEHRQIVDLIARREGEAAEEVMERHILSAMEDILRTL